MSCTLRPYQEAFIGRLRASVRAGHRRVLGVSPTGSGKTRCAASMAVGALGFGHRVMAVAGRRELVRQIASAVRDAGVPDLRVIQGDHDEGPRDARVIVGSVQTLSKERWLRALPLSQLGILDEAHHGNASTWSDLVRSQPDCRWVGLTATPERADGKPLGELFDDLVLGPSIVELTAAGHLVPCRVWAGPAELKTGELAMTPLEAYQRFALGQRAGVFCRDRAHAHAELEVFRAAGVPAAVVTGSTPERERDAALDAWRSGDILVVTSVGVLTEGFDLPELGVAILARRFGHAGPYLQVAGRILRPAPGKTGAILVDLSNSAREHGPVELERAYSLSGHAISRAVRESFTHCRACGSMLLVGPRVCPHCGAEIPVRALAPPRSVGAGVTELAPAHPRVPWVSVLAAKRDGHCRKCGQRFPRGTPILFTQGEPGSARHQQCPAPGAGGSA